MHRPLLTRIQAFLDETGMPPTLFGRRAVRDPRLVHDLLRGRQPGTRMECRVEHFMNIERAARREAAAQPIEGTRA